MATLINTGIEHDPSMLAELAALSIKPQPQDKPDRSFLDRLAALNAQPATPDTIKLDPAMRAQFEELGITQADIDAANKSEPEPRKAFKLDEAQIARLKAAGFTDEDIAEVTAAPLDPKPKSEAESRAINDRVNAVRLVERYGNDAKYIAQKRMWVYWDRGAGVWRYDLLERSTNMGKAIVEGLFEEIKSAPISSDDKAKLYKDAVKHQSGPHIRECVRLAQSDPKIAMLATAFDSHPYLLNCKNGVVNLQTGELTPHDGDKTRDLLFLKQCPVVYDPEARSNEWENFLNVALQGDQDLINYVQKAAGYSLTGDCKDEVFFFIHGQTRTGKSTFISAVNSVMGPYHLSTNFESFLQSRQRDGKGPSEDIARMRGARMISAIETSEGRRMDVGLMKKLTGRDKLTARELYEKSFEFDMTAKLWLVANDPPNVNEEDDAIWARLIELPFTFQVPPDKLDPELKPRLSDPAVTGPAILNWMVRGAVMWQKEGALTGKKPAKVQAATDAYRIRMNPVSSFIEDRCERDEEAPPYNASHLYAAYVRYFEDSNNQKWAKPIPKITFTKKMKALGFELQEKVWSEQRKVQEDLWVGIRFKDALPASAADRRKEDAAREQERAREQREVFTLLENTGDMTAENIARITDKSKDVVQQLLSELQQEGYIYKTDAGLYDVVPGSRGPVKGLPPEERARLEKRERWERKETQRRLEEESERPEPPPLTDEDAQRYEPRRRVAA